MQQKHSAVLSYILFIIIFFFFFCEILNLHVYIIIQLKYDNNDHPRIRII